jgi:hypothetical protein
MIATCVREVEDGRGDRLRCEGIETSFISFHIDRDLFHIGVGG